MASPASPWPVGRGEAWVTWPTSFAPFGRVALPSVDLTASVVCAVICSPGFAFFESIEELSSALITVPPARDASLLAVSAGVGDCAAVPATQNVARTKANAKGFMNEPPINYKFQIVG